MAQTAPRLSPHKIGILMIILLHVLKSTLFEHCVVEVCKLLKDNIKIQLDHVNRFYSRS